MSAGSYQSVKVSEIHLRDDVIKRTVSEDGVAKLVLSMDINGLQSAIRVRPLTIYKSGQPFQEWELVAGRHRLEAAKRLGWQEIDANVTNLSDNMAELAMIEENMARTDLKPAEFVYATARRKVLYELEFPETKRGAFNQHTSATRHNGDKQSSPEVDRFTKTAAEISGKGERTIQRAAAAGKAIGSVAPKLVGTSLDSITELEALSRLDPETRRALIKRAIAGEQVSAKAAKPKRERAPNKDRKLPANDNSPAAPLPMMDLTSPDHADAVLAVGEAAAEATFFQGSAPPDSPEDRKREEREDDVSISSPIADMARAAKLQAFSEVSAAMQMFESWSEDWQQEFASQFDLASFIEKYRAARATA